MLGGSPADLRPIATSGEREDAVGIGVSLERRVSRVFVKCCGTCFWGTDVGRNVVELWFPGPTRVGQ